MSSSILWCKRQPPIMLLSGRVDRLVPEVGGLKRPAVECSLITRVRVAGSPPLMLSLGRGDLFLLIGCSILAEDRH